MAVLHGRGGAESAAVICSSRSSNGHLAVLPRQVTALKEEAMRHLANTKKAMAFLRQLEEKGLFGHTQGKAGGEAMVSTLTAVVDALRQAEEAGVKRLAEIGRKRKRAIDEEEEASSSRPGQYSGFIMSSAKRMRKVVSYVAASSLPSASNQAERG